MKQLIFWLVAFVVSLISGIAVGAFFGQFDSMIAWILGGAVFFGVLSIFITCFLCYFGANALFNLATQHERDEKILAELRKMNQKNNIEE